MLKSPNIADDFDAHYDNKARQSDLATIGNWDRDMDVILVFAGLFSAILTAFLVQSYPTLQQDQQELMNASLRDITSLLSRIVQHQEGNFSSPSLPNTNTDPFRPRLMDLWINGLWFMTLALSLATAVASMLVKQWLQQYNEDLHGSSISDDSYRTRRQFRYNNLIAWRVPVIIAALPLVLHFTVMLFLCGLTILVWTINEALGLAIGTFFGASALLYIGASVMPLFYPSCPYKTSFIRGIREVLSYMVLKFWKLVLELGLRADQIYRRNRWLNSIIATSRQAARHKISFAAVETKRLRSQKTRLEFDRLVWTIRHTQQPQVVDAALRAIPQFHGDQMASKFIRFDILEQLRQRAIVQLPEPSQEFWRVMPSELLSTYTQQMQIKIPYLLSLIHVWMQDEYCLGNPPPAISVQDAMEIALLPGWLDLWRCIRNQEVAEKSSLKPSLSQGRSSPKPYLLEPFIAVVCAEMFYASLRPSPVSLDISDSFEWRKKVLNDLVEIFEAAIDQRVSLDALQLLFNTLSHSLIRRVEGPEERVRIILVLIQYAEQNMSQSSDFFWANIVRCMRILTHGELDSRRKTFLLYREQSFDPSQEIYHCVTAFSAETSNQLGQKYEFIMDTVTRWLCVSVFSRRSKSSPSHRNMVQFFTGLPALRAAEAISIVSDMISSDSPRPVLPDGLHRLSDLIREWYQTKETTTKTRKKLVDILVSICRRRQWQENRESGEAITNSEPFQTTLETIFSLFSRALTNAREQGHDYDAANYICLCCASLFDDLAELPTSSPFEGLSTGRGTEWPASRIILQHMFESEFFASCSYFLASSKCVLSTLVTWEVIVVSWESALKNAAKRSELTVLMESAYKSIRSALDAHRPLVRKRILAA